MKNKKILYTILIIFFILLLKPSSCFAATHITVKDHNNEDILLTLPDELDSYKYIIALEKYRDSDYQTFQIYWSNEPFSVSSIEGSSYLVSSDNGCYSLDYNRLTAEGYDIFSNARIEKSSTHHLQNGIQFKIIFSTFNLTDNEGNIIFQKGEYGVDFSNTNKPAEFYEGTSDTIMEEIENDISLDSTATEDNINNSVDQILNKFSFTSTITNNVNGLIDFITSIEPCPTLTLDVNSKWYSGELKVIDLSFYEPYKEAGDLIITAFAYLLFLWQVFLKLPDIINGVGSTAHGVTSYADSRVNSQIKGGIK